MLFGSTAQIRAFCGTVSVNTAWTTLAQSVSVAERKYILPALGSVFYSEVSAYLSGLEVNESTGEAVQLVKSKRRFSKLYFNPMQGRLKDDLIEWTGDSAVRAITSS